MIEQLIPGQVRVKTVWISDVHLGNIDSKVDYLLDFLDALNCETLYLVGDIIDMWSMQRTFYWPASHNQVLRKIMSMARDGVRVIYIPGNHDRVFRDYVGEQFGGIEVRRDYVHTTVDGRRLFVMHGDELDDVIRFSRFTQIIGDSAYGLLLTITRWTNGARRYFGCSYWSLSNYLKTRVSKAAQAIRHFENAAIHWAKSEGYDGVVCGHIHHNNIRHEDGILYCNDGDWMESCTSLLEMHDGRLAIVHWSDKKDLLCQLGVEASVGCDSADELLDAAV